MDQDETSRGTCWAVQCFVLSSGGEEGEVRGGRDVISQMGTLPKMFLLWKAKSGFEAIPALTLRHSTSVTQGSSKVVVLKCWPLFCCIAQVT